VELIVVVVILGVVAIAVVPRFLGSGDRALRARAEELASMLTACARRSEASGEIVSLRIDTANGRANASVRSVGGDGRSLWRDDPLLPAATFAGAQVWDIQLDGASSQRTDDAYQLVFDPASQRPGVRVIVADEAGQDLCVIELHAAAAESMVLPVPRGKDPAEVSAFPPAIDLDATGEEKEAW
jgi:type II secretory pathway pseudopilin PulG